LYNVDRIGDWLSAERLQLLQNRKKHYENQRDKIKQQVTNVCIFSVLSCLFLCGIIVIGIRFFKFPFKG